jgi:hypothetical protein
VGLLPLPSAAPLLVVDPLDLIEEWVRYNMQEDTKDSKDSKPKEFSEFNNRDQFEYFKQCNNIQGPTYSPWSRISHFGHPR